MTAIQIAHEAGKDSTFSRLFARINALKESKTLVAAFHNSAVDCALVPLVTDSSEKLFEGLKIAAWVIGAERIQLYLPLSAADAADKIADLAAENNVGLMTGIVNLRANAESCMLTITEALDIVDIINDTYFPGTYISLNGETPKKVPDSANIGELCDFSSYKAIEAGYSLLKTDDVAITVGEANIDNGILRGIPHSSCLVRVTEQMMLKYRENSCGKCVFCREGLLQLQSFVKDISDGKGKPELLDYIREIGSAMPFSTLCTLGERSSAILLDALNKFPEEFELHIRKKECPAGQCFVHETVYIDPSRCTGCGKCVGECPENAIDGKPGYIHLVDEFDCSVCKECIVSCPENAICVTRGRTPRLPDRFIPAGRFKRY